jgi:TatD DNase family protein
MKLVDTHAHLDFPQFAEPLSELIARAKNKGVEQIVNIGCDLARAQKAVLLAKKYPEISAAIGIHPDDVSENFQEQFTQIAHLAQSKEVVAIGESGFDFFHQEKDLVYETQKAAFKSHLELAKSLNKPLVIHLRNAREEALEFLQTEKPKKFVIHCFSEDWQFAEKIFELGGLISFTGIVTFPNAKLVQEVAKKAPLDKIMLETDAPFLAPQRWRGGRNEPGFVSEVAVKISELKQISIEEVAEATTKTAQDFFGL